MVQMAEATQEYSPGLEGVIAGETKISFVNPELKSLVYRGYDIKDLVEGASFEEVAYLLIKGHLPSQAHYNELITTLKAERELPEVITNAFKSFPSGKHPMDYLRAGASLLSLHDPEVGDNSHDANVRKAFRLLAKFPALITYSFRITQGKDIVHPNNDLSHAENFLYMLTGEAPDPYFAEVFDATMVCYADHGFNASTFAGRVTTSTLSDLHSGIVSAIGTLKGPLHGGANEEAMKMLKEIGTLDKAESWIKEALAQKRKIMGFGHRAYKNGDPRAFILTRMGREISERLGNTQWADIADVVERVMREDKNILPNVDFPTAYIYYLMGLPIEIYTPIFALARVSGWAAHIIEQHDGNRLIRPKALYKGEPHLEFKPLNER